MDWAQFAFQHFPFNCIEKFRNFLFIYCSLIEIKFSCWICGRCAHVFYAARPNMDKNWFFCFFMRRLFIITRWLLLQRRYAKCVRFQCVQFFENKTKKIWNNWKKREKSTAWPLTMRIFINFFFPTECISGKLARLYQKRKIFRRTKKNIFSAQFY